MDLVECDWYSDDRSNVYFDWLSAYTLWQMLLMMTIKKDVKGGGYALTHENSFFCLIVNNCCGCLFVAFAILIVYCICLFVAY